MLLLDEPLANVGNRATIIAAGNESVFMRISQIMHMHLDVFAPRLDTHIQAGF